MSKDRLPLKVAAWFILAACIVSWIIIILLASACSASMAGRPPEIFEKAKDHSAEQALAPPLSMTLQSLVFDSPSMRGRVRMIAPNTVCQTKTPLPYIIPQSQPPKINEEWKCLFVTNVCPTPPEPDSLAWIITSTREPDPSLPIDLGGIGMVGCKLLVNLDSIISVPPGTTPAGSMLSRTAGVGRILLRWTPLPGMAGQTVRMQMLVHAPGKSPSGFLMSHAIEVLVGS